MIDEAIELRVIGIPATQGNKTGFVKNGKAVLVEGRRPAARQKFSDWRHGVAEEGRRWQEQHGEPGLLEGPLMMNLTFGLPRPKSAPKTRRTWPIGALSGDVDKLARAVLDALTGVLFGDDAQVIALAVIKDYAPVPGLSVWLAPAPAVGISSASWEEGAEALVAP